MRCCPSEGGDIVWIDLSSLKHTFPNDNNLTQVEQAMKNTFEHPRGAFGCPVKYLRTTDNGLTFFANTDDININEKFRVIRAVSGGSVFSRILCRAATTHPSSKSAHLQTEVSGCVHRSVDLTVQSAVSLFYEARVK